MQLDSFLLKLLKRYEKSSAVDAVCFTECLSSLAVDGDESSLLEYTMKWTRLVNRGGLFEINNTAFMLFKEIELIVHKHLFITLILSEAQVWIVDSTKLL